MKTNRNIMRLTISTALIVILVAGAGTVWAKKGPRGQGQGNGPRGNGGPGPRIEMLAQRLDLSEEQKTAIEAIHEKTEKELVSLRKDLMKLRHEMHGEMIQDDPSEKTVLDLNRKIGAAKTEMQALKLKTRLEVRQQLTEEQRDRMLLMEGPGRGPGPDGRHGQRGMRGGMGGPGMGGPEGRFGCGQGGRGGRGACFGAGRTPAPENGQ